MKSIKKFITIVFILSQTVSICNAANYDNVMKTDYKVTAETGTDKKTEELKFYITTRTMKRIVVFPCGIKMAYYIFDNENTSSLYKDGKWENINTLLTKHTVGNKGEFTTENRKASTLEDFWCGESSGSSGNINKKEITLPETQSGILIVNVGNLTIQFRDTNNFPEIKKADKGINITDFKNWMNPFEKNMSYEKDGKKFAPVLNLIFETLMNEEAFKDYYSESAVQEESAKAYFMAYLENVCVNAVKKDSSAAGYVHNVYGLKLFQRNTNYEPLSYIPITKEEGEAIADAAVRYKQIKNGNIPSNEVYSEANNIIENNNDLGDNPVPYCENGIDCPESFLLKMSTQKQVYNKKKPYDATKYNPGGRKNGSMNGAGCDEIGMLTGVIYSAEQQLKKSFNIKFNSEKTIPENSYSEYLDNILTETDLKKTTMEDYTKDYRFSPELTAGKKTKGEAVSDSLDYVTYYVPKLNDVQKGDIIQAEYQKDPIITTVNYGIVTDIIKDNNKVTNIKVVFMSKEKAAHVPVTIIKHRLQQMCLQ